MAQFFQKYLHAAGLSSHQPATLAFMYLAGSLIALAILLSLGARAGRTEWLLGTGVGLCSYIGNFAVLRALEVVPAYAVFPVVVGGPIAVVALVSWRFMHERVSKQTKIGVWCGFLAVVLITIG
jgi:drug/metabolite transporter (DMT)-like permease